MLALLVAFAAVLAGAWYLVITPILKSQSATIKQRDDSAVDRLRAKVFEFCEVDSDTDAVPVLVLYATEYGFAREVARKTAALLARMHADVGPPVDYPEPTEPTVVLRPRVMNMLDFSAVDFGREMLVVLVVSTTGDGVPPNESEDFREALLDSSVTIPNRIQFATLALGDSSYPHFCRGGEIFDELMRSKTGHGPMLNCVKIDQEDWERILDWGEGLYSAAQKITGRDALSPRNVQHGLVPAVGEEDYLVGAVEEYALANAGPSARFSRANPYCAKLAARYPLCQRSGVDVPDPKTVIRVEVAVDPFEIAYEPGDALGLLPRNNSESVARLLQVMACNGDERVTVDGVQPSIPLEEALMERLDLRVIRADLIAALASRTVTKTEKSLAERLLMHSPDAPSTSVKVATLSDEGAAYVAERHVIDVLTDFPSAQLPVQSFVQFLRPLHARYYSISSSPRRNKSIIAATLDVVRYNTRGVAREGVASTFLNDRVRPGDDVQMFISKNVNFRLPSDDTRPVIMIGPGTGIAPFIAFMEDREEAGARGRNILFFGCRHERHDFLYKDRLQEWEADGFLELVTAFSRDEAEKVYVTHRLLERGEEVWRLFDEEEAYLYVCGDGNRMAQDVNNALVRIVQKHGGRSSPEEAGQFLEGLSAKRRYQRDVWVS